MNHFKELCEVLKKINASFDHGHPRESMNDSGASTDSRFRGNNSLILCQ